LIDDQFSEAPAVVAPEAEVMPLALSSGGLPIGVQLAAPLGEDARLLALAAWVEREQPWQSRLSALRRGFLGPGGR
jgi:Asp-tRNA(Asn)/Glu-tRNA(Gln) amidotransferase A subunit family amidase